MNFSKFTMFYKVLNKILMMKLIINSIMTLLSADTVKNFCSVWQSSGTASKNLATIDSSPSVIDSL